VSQLEESLLFQLKALGCEEPVREYRFIRELVGNEAGVKARLKARGLKDYRFDMAWPAYRFAVEVEGGGWVGGRHTRGAGFQADIEKYHYALALGWVVYRTEGSLISSGASAELIQAFLGRLAYLTSGEAQDGPVKRHGAS